jgi:NAD+ kinase
MKLHFIASSQPEAQAHYREMTKEYGQAELEKCDHIIALGGDGIMLQALKATFVSGTPVFGMNCGTVGFLMNEYRSKDLIARIKAAEETIIHPLEMQATDRHGKSVTAHGINEVSLLRESHQAARIRIKIDNITRLDELVCDGVLLATAAGSTAYNFSAHGPIIPLGSDVLALTPLSPFRPRRWRGALLPDYSQVEFEILDAGWRPVSATADSFRINAINHVAVKLDEDISLTLLSDPGHGLEEKAMKEQFLL